MDEEKQNEHHVRAFYEATAVLRQNIVSPSHLGIPIQRRDLPDVGRATAGMI